MKSALLSSIVALVALALPTFVSAQLSGSVGPLTTAATKLASKTCNVLDYGAVASTDDDIGDALSAAWADCLTDGMGKLPRNRQV